MSQPSQPTESAKRWDAASYNRTFRFVTSHGEAVLDDLAVQAGERVLDLGCGTGELTAKIAELGAEVVALDMDSEMIRRARERYPRLRFEQADAHSFAVGERFDAVFSNAALHWMPRPAEVIGRVWAALRPGGRFVAEMGGKGNVSGIELALQRARAEVGVTARSSPWFFPSIATYARLLEEGGFEPRRLTLFERLTPLQEGEGGMVDWMQMFGSPFLEDLSAEQRQTVLHRAAELIRPALYRDNRWCVDYRRLRFAATAVEG